MNLKNKKQQMQIAKKIAGAFFTAAFSGLIAFTAVFSFPQKAEAVFVPTLDSFNLVVNTLTSKATTAVDIKETIIDPIFFVAKQAVINQITKNVLGMVGGGVNSNSPMFVTNIQQSLSDAGATATKNLATQITSDNSGTSLDPAGPRGAAGEAGIQGGTDTNSGGEGDFDNTGDKGAAGQAGQPSNSATSTNSTPNYSSGACSYFKQSITSALSKNSSSSGYGKDFKSQTSCTLDSATGGQSAAFMNGDWSKGGWDAWLKLTQEPQNNPYGYYAMMLSEMDSQQTAAQSAKVLDIIANNGFTSQTDSTGNVTTPGVILKDQISNVLSSPLRQLEAADEMNEVIGQLATQLLNQALSRGLSSLTQATNDGTPNGAKSFLDQLANETQNPRDNNGSGITRTVDGSELSSYVGDGTGNSTTDANGNFLVNKITDPTKITATAGPTSNHSANSAIDGDKSSDLSKTTASISQGSQPYWQVDMSTVRSIDHLVIHPVVTDATGAIVSTTTSMGIFTVSLYTDLVNAPTKTVTISDMEQNHTKAIPNLNADARYIVIKRIDSGSTLELAEVEIYENPPVADSAPANNGGGLGLNSQTPEPSVSFTVGPTTASQSSSMTIATSTPMTFVWASSGAQPDFTCSATPANGGWSGPLPSTGSKSILSSLYAGSNTYTLDCYHSQDNWGSQPIPHVSRSVTVSTY